MHQCPHCQSTERQVKSGFNRTGSQRLQCQACRRQYTPDSNPPGYDDKTREAALKLYLERMRPRYPVHLIDAVSYLILVTPRT